MAVNVSVGQTPDTGIKVKVGDGKPNVSVEMPKPEKVSEFKLKSRKTLNGDIMIFDHTDIDIIIMAEKNKVVAFAKDLMSDSVYGAESRLFEFLKKKGIVKYDSIQGGNVYGSLEATILESNEKDSIKLTLLNISKWMDSERPQFESSRAFEEMMDDYLLDPDAKDSTEFGEVPHEEKKGSILQHNLFAPYLYGRYTY